MESCRTKGFNPDRANSCTVSCTNIRHAAIPNHDHFVFLMRNSFTLDQSRKWVAKGFSPVPINSKFFNCSFNTFLELFETTIMRIPVSRRSCNHRFSSLESCQVIYREYYLKSTKTAFIPSFCRLSVKSYTASTAKIWHVDVQSPFWLLLFISLAFKLLR